MFHGPRECVQPFFEGLGFVCPPSKGVADFLQDVTLHQEQPVGAFFTCGCLLLLVPAVSNRPTGAACSQALEGSAPAHTQPRLNPAPPCPAAQFYWSGAKGEWQYLSPKAVEEAYRGTDYGAAFVAELDMPAAEEKEGHGELALHKWVLCGSFGQEV